jgi:putative DNA primase/helicase
MIEAARSEQGMFVMSPAEFDADPDKLTLTNGVLDLRTGQLDENPKPTNRVCKLAGAGFDPNAKAPLFMDFLRAVLPDKNVRSFVQRAVGYSLTGSVEEECAFVLYGTGANGKSVFGNILLALLGEYAATSGAALLTRGRLGNEGDRLAADLPGKRVALVNETALGDLWDSERIKTLASREPMTARRLYAEPFSFMPSAKIWLRTNHLPGSLDAGDGFWRRIFPIPFTVQIPSEKRIPSLDRRIIAGELSGVLNWAVTGARRWFEAGCKLNPPAEILDIVSEYRSDTDVLGMWIAERTQADPQECVRVAEAWQSYQDFCREKNISSGSEPMFSRAMTARGVRRAASRKNGRRYQGFRLCFSLFNREDDDDDII